MDNTDVDSLVMQRKLQSKVEALNIVKRQMEQFRIERDQFKLMAETLQLRYSTMKKSLNDAQPLGYGLGETSHVATLVSETREKNIALNTEVEALRQRVDELEGDVNVLRGKLAEKSRVLERSNSIGGSSDNGDASKREKFELIAQMESLKKKNMQLKYDFRILLDEKEEVIIDRDAYKCKVHRLNHELNIALKSDSSQAKVLDIDSLVLENSILQERLNNIESELSLSRQSCAKYKTMLDTKRKKGIIKLGSNQSDMIMSHKQVKTLLETGTVSELPTKAETINDLKSLCLALLDSLNDKTLALTHQKKANKILATRISQLEQKFLIGDRTSADDLKLTTLSPSAILLSGYSPATVDQEIRRSSIESDLADLRRRLAEMDDEDGNKIDDDASVVVATEQTEEAMERLTNESIRSEPSVSDFEGSGQSTSDISTTTNKSDIRVGSRLDLEDLPADVAEVIRQAMQEDSAQQANDGEEVGAD